MDSTGVGGRPWVAWNVADSSPAAGFDVCPPRGPRRVQGRVDPDDLSDGPFAWVAPGALGEPDAEVGAQVFLQGRVVRL